MTDKYVEKQLDFYEKAVCEAAKDDALYRMGTHLDIVSVEKTSDNLTDEERQAIFEAVKGGQKSE